MRQRRSRRTVWRRPVTVVLATDASREGHLASRPTRSGRLEGGWGAVLFRQGDRSLLEPAMQAAALAGVGVMDPARWDHARVAHGVWTPEELQHHINFLELRGLRRGVEAFAEEGLRGAQGLSWQDNMAVTQIVNNLVSRSPAMHHELMLLVALLAELDLELLLRWISTTRNPSDYWSRIDYTSDWTLSQRLLTSIFDRWGVPTIDRFSQQHDHVVQRFNSPYPCRSAEATDCWTQAWDSEFNWLNPPWALIARALSKVERTPTCAAVIIVPLWPASWWPQLQELAVDGFELQLTPTDVVPGPLARACPEPLRNDSWRLGAFYIPPGDARFSRRPTLATTAVGLLAHANAPGWDPELSRLSSAATPSPERSARSSSMRLPSSTIGKSRTGLSGTSWSAGTPCAAATRRSVRSLAGCTAALSTRTSTVGQVPSTASSTPTAVCGRSTRTRSRTSKSATMTSSYSARCSALVPQRSSRPKLVSACRPAGCRYCFAMLLPLLLMWFGVHLSVAPA